MPVAHRSGRIAVSIALAAALTVVLLLAATNTAAAASCTRSRYFEQNDGYARSYGTVNTNCNDGSVHATAWLWDINCDSRPAYVQFWFSSRVTAIAPPYQFKRENRGCGNGDTFDISVPASDWLGFPFHHVRICAYAKSTPGLATPGDCDTYNAP